MMQVPENIKRMALMAHEVLHDPTKRSLSTDDRIYPIVTYRNGTRGIVLDNGYLVVEQDRKKGSSYAQRAASGERLTWVIPSDPDVAYFLIEDPKAE